MLSCVCGYHEYQSLDGGSRKNFGAKGKGHEIQWIPMLL